MEKALAWVLFSYTYSLAIIRFFKSLLVSWPLRHVIEFDKLPK